MAETAVAANRFLRGAVRLMDIVVTPFMGREQQTWGARFQAPNE
jgi:hypothetical protein